MSPGSRLTGDVPQGKTREDLRTRRLGDYSVHRSVPTRWADHDMYNHVNNAIHYEVMDTAVNGWLLDATGVDIRTLPAMGLVVETGCRYFQQVHFPQTLVVGLRLEGSGRSSVRYELGLFTDGQTPAAVARFVHVYVDRSTGATVPVPVEVERALDQLRIGVANEQPG